MKRIASAFIIPAIALSLGLVVVVPAQGGDPPPPWAGKVPATPAMAEMGEEPLIYLPIVQFNSSGEIEPPTPIPPLVVSLDGSSVAAGSDLRVRIEYHAPGQGYDVYLVSPAPGYVGICYSLQTDVFGMVALAACHVPEATTPGAYQLVTLAAGDDPDPAHHVAEGDLVDVLLAGAPTLIIQDSNRWPAGATITFRLFGHPPCPPWVYPCPPNQVYDIALIGPGFPSPGVLITAVRVDDFGGASAPWVIPSRLAPGGYTVVTFEQNTVDPVIASAALEVVTASIVVQGGNRWPAGATIGVHLRSHAPNRTYRLRWIEGGTGITTDMGLLTTDPFGDSPVPLRFQIPAGTTDSPPAHRIVSLEEGGAGAIVASAEVEVFTP